MKFYNIVPHLPEKLPPYVDEDGKPLGRKAFEKLFPKEVVRQEFSEEPFIKVPDELEELYINVAKRPRPLQRARRLEKKLGLEKTKIYMKREDLSPTGSHKLNTALAQLYYAKEDTDFVTTETGAGQWGTAVALASALVGIRAEIFMVGLSYNQKPFRRALMHIYNASVYPSPSHMTSVGKRFLEEGKKKGSLGIAIAEAVERAVSAGGKYVLGSVLNAVLMHQTVIGEEVLRQLEEDGEEATDVIACFGGGSNFGGIVFPFYRQYYRRGKDITFIAAEASEVPSLTKGGYIYDYGDSAKLTPKMKMYSLGFSFMPPPIYAGGLRYHGASPAVSLLVKHGIVEPRSYSEAEARKAAFLMAHTEGLIIAPETAHAIAATIERAREREEDGGGVIVVNLSGHGLLDLSFYEGEHESSYAKGQ